MIALLIDRYCPRCTGWCYIEPDLGPGWWLVCLCCGWEHWLGPGEPSTVSAYSRVDGPHRGRYQRDTVCEARAQRDLAAYVAG